jgi:AraC family transcriptional regulator
MLRDRQKVVRSTEDLVFDRQEQSTSVALNATHSVVRPRGSDAKSDAEPICFVHRRMLDESAHATSERTSRSSSAWLPAHLAHLIDRAMLFLETDLEISKRSLRDAGELLKERRPRLQSLVSSQGVIRRGGLARWRVKRACDYIEENLGSPLNAGAIARSVGLSSSHFARAFKASLGVTLGTYVTRMRIERAKRMIRSTRMSLCDISVDCGFCDQAHFSRSFRCVVGITPRMWRSVRASTEFLQVMHVSGSVDEAKAGLPPLVCPDTVKLWRLED